MRPNQNSQPCRGPSRRELLKVGVLSAWGLALEDVLRLRAWAGSEPGSSYGSAGSQAPAAKAQSCILIWLAGGPSHLDTFDPKPDAPSEIRGEFDSIETAVPGLRISEVLPNLAACMDQMTLIRSLTSPEVDHDRATHHLLTGYRPSPALVYPSFGSVVSRVRGTMGRALPSYVAVPEAPLFASSGYLTPAFDPFEAGNDPNAPNFRVRDLTPPDRVTLERLRRRQRMVQTLDDFASDVPATPLTRSRDEFSDQAYDLLTSSAAQDAFQIDREPSETRERYGRTPVGQACLLARRLVEAGVGFVTINDRGMGQLGWDTHVQNFPAIRDQLAPPMDQGVSALVADLAARGLLDSTLVVMMGEFGRTPRINGSAGRDHHPRSNSLILAGAGVPGGLVLGQTDAKADLPAERPITPADLAATIYTLLGIDPHRQFETPDGQPIRLVDDGTVIGEVV